MKLCPTCGEVYPDRATHCRAHDAALLDWNEVSDTHTAAPTAVDDSSGPLSDTGTHTIPGDLTNPEVPLHAAPTPPVIVEMPEAGGTPRPTRVLGGRYRLGRHIGIGGYGAVFDAYDERLDKRVAVKLLSPTVAQDPHIVHRFKREAIAASRVRHECIVDVTDYDIDAEGVSFIVMEFLDGRDLSEVIASEAPLSPARALAIVAQCASALTAAHAAGILHRDLKPANIFLVRSASRPDFVKIIDFGISKLTNDDGQFSNVTDASKVVGTPFYMPPEQGQGKALDGRTDLYALGIILFEAVTGVRPFVGSSALEILTNAMTQARVPPSARRHELAEIAGLDELVLRAIASDREQRFGSMRQFGEAVVACLAELDPARLLGLPAIVHHPGADEAERLRPVPHSTVATEIVQPITLESSSGEITATRTARAPGRWTLPVLATVLVAAIAALLWVRSISHRKPVVNIEAAGAPAAAASAPPAPEPTPPEPEAKPPAPEAKPPAPEAKPPAPEAKPPAPEAKPPAPPPPPRLAERSAEAPVAVDAGTQNSHRARAKPPRPKRAKRHQRRARAKPRPPVKHTAKQPSSPGIGIKDW